jgi:hypothetical protein
MKANVYTADVDCVLDSIRFWAGSTSTVNAGVWEQQGSNYVSVFQGTFSPGTTTKSWRTVSNVNVSLTGGTNYVVAMWWPSSVTVYYAYSASGAFASPAWGAMVDWDDVISMPSGFPNAISASPFNTSGQTAGGYRQELTVTVDSDSDNDGFTTLDGDCDDSDPFVYPGAPELCDGIDGDCNGALPADEADADFDGVMQCEGDCDDFDGFTYPLAPELCDGLDNDCDVAVDEGLSPDVDGDGYTALGACQGTANDCDDGQFSVNPGASEVCDGLDNNCNGSADEGLSTDQDSDGVTAPGSCLGTADDCDDTDPFTFPGATELCDGADNNCDGGLLAGEGDTDGDGYLGCDDDCNDGDPDINPGVSEDCGNGLDDNCNGSVDEDIDADGDGFGTCEDCNDNLAAQNPGADEVACDGIDTDCDGALDPMEADADGDGVTACDDDCDDDNADTYPGAEEVCDNQDNDCDGEVPEDEADCAGDDDDDNGGGGGGGGRRSTGCALSAGDTPSLALALALFAVVSASRRRWSAPGR